MTQTITAITVQKKNPKRVNLYLDGEFAFGLSRITAAWLTIGQELSAEKITALRTEDELEGAYQKSLKFLSYRIRTEQEIRRKLISHSFSGEVIDRTITKLKTLGLVDDQKFARDWVENRVEFRPRSKRALSYELKHLGIHEEHIETALEEVDDECMAYMAASKQFRKYRNSDWQEFRNKMLGFLSRRGFNYEICSQTMTRVWDERRVENKTIENEAEI